MRDVTIRTREKIFDFAKNYSLKLIFLKTMYFIAGMLISRGVIFGNYYPFGLSFSASVPVKLITPTVIGTIFGYLFPLKISTSIRYISTVISITAIRWTLSDLTKIKSHFLYTPTVVFLSSLITGLAVNSAEGFSGRDISVSILESIVAAAAGFFFDNSFKILSKKRIYELNSSEFTCVAISISLLLLSLSEIYLFGVSVGHVLAILMILIFASVMGVTGGTVSGIATGIIFSLPSFGFTYISGAYSFAGMIAGFCCSFGKIGVSFAFLVSNILISFQSGDVSKLISNIYESIIAIIIFMISPNYLFNKFKGTTICSCDNTKPNFINEALMQQLRFTSQSLSIVPNFIDKISSKLLDSPKANIKELCVHSIYSVCSSCGLCNLCWCSKKVETQKELNNIINLAVSKNVISEKNFSADFLRRCRKTDVLINEVIKNYEEFRIQKNVKTNFVEMREIVSEQISGVSSVIEELSEEISKKCFFDKELSNKLWQELSKISIDTKGIVCKKDEFQRLFIEIECSETYKDKFTKNVMKKISSICGRRMDEPIINIYDDMCRIQICEPKIFDIDFGISQHIFDNGKYCGDSFCKFQDGTGCMNVIISDGMGTGGKAALQGAITSKLMENFVKSGMSFNSSIKFVNSLLLLRSGEEMLSTLDALSINLFTGEAKFMKAGSPFTFIVRGDKIIKVNFESLPIGILHNVSFSSETVNLQDKDLIIMLSDGATDIGEEWIVEVIKNKEYRTVSELSKAIVNKAVMFRKFGHDDDITAIVINFFKNNR